jgi:dolichol-phosphate mannosyltransferase
MRTVVFIPTYNERENVERLFLEITALGLGLDILFMDDNSPDGTGQILDDLAVSNSHLTVLHRQGKLGIGSAHREGIRWAYEHGYEFLITMDCDFTHSPQTILALLKEKDKADIVVGSRYMLKDSLEGWNLFRCILTKLGHILTVVFLKLPYDATGALRLYRLQRIPPSLFDRVRSQGYSFLYESLFILNYNKFRILEIPIKLPARTYGHSKMRLVDAWQSFRRLLVLFFHRLFNRKRFEVQWPLTSPLKDTSTAQEEWEEYWAKKNSVGGGLYDVIAAFYRMVIIRPALNYFIREYFKPGEEVLHAGCGGGQVDKDIGSYIRITAMDHSVNALNSYRKVNGAGSSVVLGSIFKIPVADHSFDGVYNLGVMEHFSEEDIHHILLEFRRILKPGGRVVLFWPPEFGCSVVFLEGVRRIFSWVLRKDIKIHPDEITRIRCREHVEGMVRRAGFDMVFYYFGPRDLFTQCVVVIEPVKRGGV